MTTASPHVWKRARAAMELLLEHGMSFTVRVAPDGSVEVASGAQRGQDKTPQQEEGWKVEPDAIKQAEAALSRRRPTKDQG